jgi:hypothetical protein
VWLFGASRTPMVSCPCRCRIGPDSGPMFVK